MKIENTSGRKSKREYKWMKIENRIENRKYNSMKIENGVENRKYNSMKSALLGHRKTVSVEDYNTNVCIRFVNFL